MIRSVCFIMGVFIALLLIITNTSLGLALIIQMLPGQARAQEISGTLLHGWQIKKFTYKNDSFNLSMDEMTLDWQASALLFQDLLINNINIKNMTLDFPETKSTNTAFTLSAIHLPININLKQVILENSNIHYQNKNYLINTTKFSGELINNVLGIQQLFIQTPLFSTSSTGSVNMSTWSEILFNNQFDWSSQKNASILTTITGDQKALSLHITSKKWLDIDMGLQHYLENSGNITINARWFIDINKTIFPELKKLDGKFQFTGSANGNLLKPNISWKLFLKNITYNTSKIQNLQSTLDFSLNDKQKINFSLLGNNIYNGDTLVNKIDTTLKGDLKSHKINIALQVFDSDFYTFSSNGGMKNAHTYSLKNATLNAQPLNLVFYPINIDVSLKKKNTLSYNADIQQHNEKLTIAGVTQFAFPDFKTTLSLSSNQFTLINTALYKIVVALHLNLNHDQHLTKITGNTEILSALIAPIDLSNTITLTKDMVYVDNQWQPLYEKDKPLNLLIDVLLKIKKLTFNYKGAEADVTGNIKLIQKPLAELNAFGQLLFLHGTYKTYGQKLTIQKNSALNFNGAYDNPSLNITASKEISVSPEYIQLPSFQPYLIAGIQVTGTADQPSIHLFSNPTGISQQDILSYLLFGFPQSNLTGAQTSLLWNALSAMSPGQSNFSLSSLQSSIKEELGFSEFGLGNTSEYNSATQQYETGTAFVVGKRITSDLTATYNVGLLVPVNVLYLRYQLSQRWALQSDSSALGNGGDLLYTIRRD